LKNFGQQDTWFETLDELTSTIKSTTNWIPEVRRSVLDLILDKVVLSHDQKALLHNLVITLRIPLVLSGNKKGASKDAPVISLSKSLKVSDDITHSGSLYSTVTDFAKLRG